MGCGASAPTTSAPSRVSNSQQQLPHAANESPAAEIQAANVPVDDHHQLRFIEAINHHRRERRPSTDSLDSAVTQSTDPLHDAKRVPGDSSLIVVDGASNSKAGSGSCSLLTHGSPCCRDSDGATRATRQGGMHRSGWRRALDDHMTPPDGTILLSGSVTSAHALSISWTLPPTSATHHRSEAVDIFRQAPLSLTHANLALLQQQCLHE